MESTMGWIIDKIKGVLPDRRIDGGSIERIKWVIIKLGCPEIRSFLLEQKKAKRIDDLMLEEIFGFGLFQHNEAIIKAISENDTLYSAITDMRLQGALFVTYKTNDPQGFELVKGFLAKNGALKINPVERLNFLKTGLSIEDESMFLKGLDVFLQEVPGEEDRQEIYKNLGFILIDNDEKTEMKRLLRYVDIHDIAYLYDNAEKSGWGLTTEDLTGIIEEVRLEKEAEELKNLMESTVKKPLARPKRRTI